MDAEEAVAFCTKSLRQAGGCSRFPVGEESGESVLLRLRRVLDFATGRPGSRPADLVTGVLGSEAIWKATVVAEANCG